MDVERGFLSDPDQGSQNGELCDGNGRQISLVSGADSRKANEGGEYKGDGYEQPNADHVCAARTVVARVMCLRVRASGLAVDPVVKAQRFACQQACRVPKPERSRNADLGPARGSSYFPEALAESQLGRHANGLRTSPITSSV